MNAALLQVACPSPRPRWIAKRSDLRASSQDLFELSQDVQSFFHRFRARLIFKLLSACVVNICNPVIPLL
jgi:hypothetical protein